MVKHGLLKRLAELINSDKLSGYRITTKCLSVVSYLLVNHKETIYKHGIIKSVLKMLNETKNVQVQQRSLELIGEYQGIFHSIFSRSPLLFLIDSRSYLKSN
jgi:DNA-binding winged helix-turn-helix (wHTH) protein